MSDFEIRDAQHDDQGRLGPLLQDLLGPALEPEHDRARAAGFSVSSVEDELMAADDWYFSSIDLMNCCWFAWVGEEAVGACAVNPYLNEIQYLVVHPDRRRQGIGTALLQTATAEFARRGIGHLKMEVPPSDEALGFFRAAGFAEVRSRVQVGSHLS